MTSETQLSIIGDSGSLLDEIDKSMNDLIQFISDMDEESKIIAINRARHLLHDISPFKSEPVDYVAWIPSDSVYANDYNPNSVAPPEMELLAHSIATDGYTQPIVTFPTEKGREVVDGFHRNRVGKENIVVRSRVKGYLPVVAIKSSQTNLNDRIAATIRHNRARGKHRVDAMSEIVVELKRRNWSAEKIAKELGMDQDEILRLCQITGLAELFADEEFSASWDVDGEITESDFEELTDERIDDDSFRKAPTGGEDRIFHTYDKWECYKAGFYNTTHQSLTKVQCEEKYRAFLSDTDRFSEALESVTTEWVNSCEHYLTNNSMNRIAWLGQASACYAMGIPAIFRSGFFLLTEQEQEKANQTALKYLNKWLSSNGRKEVTMEEAYSGQSDLY